jgi:hypothetical protein
LFNPADHALAVDRGGLEADGLGNPQTRRVADGQDHPVLEVVHGAQHNRQPLRLMAGGDVIVDRPRPFEGDGEEKPQRGDRDDDRTGREASLLRQVDQIRPDLSWPKQLWRLAEIAGEPSDLRDVHTLRVRRQVADLHIIDHTAAKRAH